MPSPASSLLMLAEPLVHTSSWLMASKATSGLWSSHHVELLHQLIQLLVLLFHASVWLDISCRVLVLIPVPLISHILLLDLTDLLYLILTHMQRPAVNVHIVKALPRLFGVLRMHEADECIYLGACLTAVLLQLHLFDLSIVLEKNRELLFSPRIGEVLDIEV